MNDPVPQAVRRQVHVHSMVVPNHDMGQAQIMREQEERAFWTGMREVIRDEMTQLLDERERRD